MNDINGANSFSPCGCSSRYGLNSGRILFNSNNIPTDNQGTESVDKVNIGDSFEFNSQESVELGDCTPKVNFETKDTLEKSNVSTPSIKSDNTFTNFSLINSNKEVAFSDNGTITIMDDFGVSDNLVSASIGTKSVPESLISDKVFFNSFDSVVKNGIFDVDGNRLGK